MAKMGRPSVFSPKDRSCRYQGLMTRVGAKRFETARVRLGRLAGLPTTSVSDGDVFEFLARGEDATQAYLTRST